MDRILAGRRVNPIGLGCMSLSWAYGVAPAEDYAVSLLNRALDLGYNHLDTANIYLWSRSQRNAAGQGA